MIEEVFDVEAVVFLEIPKLALGQIENMTEKTS